MKLIMCHDVKGDTLLVRRPASQKARWSEGPLVRRPDSQKIS